MNDPRLILADEPTGSLDERSSAQIKELLFGLVREYRKTMILVTHSRELAAFGDQQLVLEHGRLRRA
jgi:ABC-type lipoprotein export system ATPase subunit